MKKIFLYTCFLVALGSCSESEFEFHQTYFTPQEIDGKVLYADQTNDSTLLVSYDPWKASLLFADENEWFSITPNEYQFVKGMQYSETKVYISTTPNTSGKSRIGLIQINTYDIKSTELVGLKVYQHPWLNIVKPHGIWNAEMAMETFTINFDSPHSGQFEVKFTVYDENATLISGAEWLRPATVAITPGKQQSVTVNIDENTDTSEPRTATLVLKSKGIETPISVTQAKANY